VEEGSASGEKDEGEDDDEEDVLNKEWMTRFANAKKSEERPPGCFLNTPLPPSSEKEGLANNTSKTTPASGKALVIATAGLSEITVRPYGHPATPNAGLNGLL
jgi:hypothetical protein